jgi:L-threonylcarbamoyladenylate synthase
MAEWAPEQLKTWLAALKAGEVAAAPAEGVYGYVADPFDAAALAKVMALKARDPGKGLIVLIRSADELPLLCPRRLPAAVQIAVGASWPCPPERPVTLVLPARKGLPELLTGGRGTVAVRCPATPYMREYLEAWKGPLVSTSLNLSGEPPVTEGAAISPGVAALTLSRPLSGCVSRVFDPVANTWLR